MQKTKPICLCASNLPAEIITRLSEDANVIPLPPDRTVDTPVQCHPDMICSVIDGTVYFHESYAEAYPALIREIAEKSGYGITLTCGRRSPKYPEDISLNAAVLPDALICRKSHTAPELIDAAEKTPKCVINVSQGYSACSCLVSENAVLTTDPGIFRTLTALHRDCTYISSDGILLPGYGCGFIGGCGGTHEGKLYLFGSDESLRDRDVLLRFAENHGLGIVYLSPDPLTDYGGLKFL